jgi:hypothetical protein
MEKDVVPTPDQQVALVNEAPERMIGRARSWLEDKKVKTTLQSFDPDQNANGSARRAPPRRCDRVRYQGSTNLGRGGG